jgi:hypothetical protein
VRTHPVDKLLEQHCYESAAGLLQLVRFYLCTQILDSSFDEFLDTKKRIGAHCGVNGNLMHIMVIYKNHAPARIAVKGLILHVNLNLVNSWSK